VKRDGLTAGFLSNPTHFEEGIFIETDKTGFTNKIVPQKILILLNYIDGIVQFHYSGAQ